MVEPETWIKKAIEEHVSGVKEEYVIWDQETFFGMVSPRFLSQSVVDVGTWISPQQQRKGYGKKILTELFERLCVKGVEKVTYETEPKNKASIQLALSAGFILVEEGEEMKFQKSLLSD